MTSGPASVRGVRGAGGRRGRGPRHRRRGTGRSTGWGARRLATRRGGFTLAFARAAFRRMRGRGTTGEPARSGRAPPISSSEITRKATGITGAHGSVGTAAGQRAFSMRTDQVPFEKNACITWPLTTACLENVGWPPHGVAGDSASFATPFGASGSVITRKASAIDGGATERPHGGRSSDFSDRRPRIATRFRTCTDFGADPSSDGGPGPGRGEPRK